MCVRLGSAVEGGCVWWKGQCGDVHDRNRTVLLHVPAVLACVDGRTRLLLRRIGSG